MPKVWDQKKNNRGEAKCGRCGQLIQPGERYKMWSFRFGPTHYRCYRMACAPRASELTQSKASGMHELLERKSDATAAVHINDNFEDFLTDMEAIKDDAESVRDDIQEGYDNMGDNLQQTEQGEVAQRRIEALDNFIDEMDSAIDEVRGKIEEFEPAGDAEESKEALVIEIADQFDGIDMEVE
jgi:hypothetical protein